ncbi:MAG: molecular chaperone DnaJ [Candidatus Hydrogenedentes bacterium]|nr:molecular chaperone DnaJ [Candidatus Hydrogenedentota bacterium]
MLGVSRDASADEIRKAYLKLAHKHHPDKTGGDKASEEKLKEINAAYDILKNKDKRAQYDQFGEGGNPFGSGGFSGAGGAGGFEAPFEDLFDMLFGGRGGRSGQGRSAAVQGNDIETRLTIELREAALGCKKTIHFDRMDLCAECKGSGAAPGSKPQTCPQCQGAGQVRSAQGFFSVTRTCPRCHGSGQSISNPCHKCHGNGRVRTRRDVTVDIPPGVDTGSRMRLSGEGEPGHNGGPRGDLYIFIQVQPSDIFERDGVTILCEVPISFTQATLGATIRVPTLTGEAELKVPAGTQSGSMLRLRGLGMPDLQGYRQGDQIVRVQVETPAKLSRRQRELLEEFQKLAEEKSYPLHLRFLDKLKKFQQK